MIDLFADVFARSKERDHVATRHVADGNILLSERLAFASPVKSQNDLVKAFVQSAHLP